MMEKSSAVHQMFVLSSRDKLLKCGIHAASLLTVDLVVEMCSVQSAVALGEMLSKGLGLAHAAAVASISNIRPGIARRVTPKSVIGGATWWGPKRMPIRSKFCRAASTSVA